MAHEFSMAGRYHYGTRFVRVPHQRRFRWWRNVLLSLINDDAPGATPPVKVSPI